MITIRIRVATPDNIILGYIAKFKRLEYVLRGDGKIGACTFTVAASYYKWLSPENADYRITVWRSVNNQPDKLEGDTEFLVSTIEMTTDEITVNAFSLQELTRRRYIAYPANNATYTVFNSQYTGNIMKALVRYNMTSSLNAIRDGDDSYVAIPGLSVDADANDGIVTSISCSRNNLYDILQQLSADSISSGSWIVGSIVSDGAAWTFKTFPLYFGIDRTTQQSLSIFNRNVEQVSLLYDYTQEYNFVGVGGAGTEVNRIIATASGPGITRSTYARKEYFYSNTQLRTTSQADNAARFLTRTYRPVFGFKCALLQSPAFVRGINYDVGDILNVEFLGAVYRTRLDVVNISVGSGGLRERAELRLV